MTTRRTRPWRKNTLQAQIKSSLFEGLNSCGFVVIPQHPGKWKEALRELLSLIRRVCGFEVFPPNEAPCDFQSELNKELQINRADWKFFEICKNVCFLKYPQDKASLLRPSELVIKLFEYVQQDKDEIISQAVRILPVDIMTQPKLNDVTGVLNKLLPAYFPGLKIPEITPVEEMLPTFRVSSGDTWAVRFEKRVSGRVQRDETIQAIGKILDLTDETTKALVYPVNLTDETVSVCVESNSLFVGIAICKDFHKFKKFNIRSVCEARTKDPIPSPDTSPRQ